MVRERGSKAGWFRLARAGRFALALAGLAPCAAAQGPAADSAVADFYRGKTLRIVVGYNAGGGFDRNARILARHLARHLPGAPGVVVENKPGAGSALAANTVYATEPNDGSVLLTFEPGLTVRQALGAKELRFDMAKFHWLASLGSAPYVCVGRRSAAGSIRDVMGGKEVVLGTTGFGTTTHDAPLVMNATLGTKFKLVSGYNNLPAIRKAVESGEVDGFCQAWTTLVTESRHLLEGENAPLRPLVVMGERAPDHPLLRELPAVDALAKSAEDKQVLRAVYAPNNISYPFVAGPRVPAERVAALRRAVAAALADPALIADMQKVGQPLEPQSGEEIQRTIEAVLRMPPAVLERLKRILKG